MKALKILAFVLAGGEGTRLHPLTSERSKPAVPFAGRYRIGYDLDADRKQYHVTDSGIVIVSKGRHRLDDTHYY